MVMFKYEVNTGEGSKILHTSDATTSGTIQERRFAERLFLFSHEQYIHTHHLPKKLILHKMKFVTIIIQEIIRKIYLIQYFLNIGINKNNGQIPPKG